MAPGRKNKATRTCRYLRPASQAAKPRKKSQVEFSFHREVSRKPIYIEREFFLFFDLFTFPCLYYLPP